MACFSLSAGTWLSSFILALVSFVTVAQAANANKLQIYNSSTTYHYGGCWNETTEVSGTSGARALPDLSLEQPGNMTVEICLDFCAHNQTTSYKYAGLEYSRQCWCANHLNSLSVLLDDSACDTACDGDTAQACGGALKLTLYNATSTDTKKNAAARIGGEARAAGGLVGMALVVVVAAGLL